MTMRGSTSSSTATNRALQTTGSPLVGAAGTNNRGTEYIVAATAVVQLSLRLAVSVEDFYGPDLVANLAILLEVCVCVVCFAAPCVRADGLSGLVWRFCRSWTGSLACVQRRAVNTACVLLYEDRAGLCICLPC